MPQGRARRHAASSTGPTGIERLSDARNRQASPVAVLLRTARDTLIPPLCLGCSRPVDTDGVLCPACWAKIDFIGHPMCETCGLPFPHDQFSTLCAECARKTPPFRRARSAVVYTEESRRLIIAYKHADKMEAAGLFARWMLAAGGSMLDEVDIIVPVPLHRRRLFRRRFNQAAVIASLIGREAGLPVALDALERIKPSPPPGKASRGERRRAVAGAFKIAGGQENAVAGARVLVVDDVMTTGATSRAVAGRLNRGRAAAVDVLTVARALRNGAG